MIQEPLNIVVAVPSGPHWLADFATSLIGMLGHFSNHRASLSGVQQYRVVNVKGSILPRQRLNALQAAKQVNASHLFFVDRDHTFPPDMLNRLLKWDKDCVAANCVTKSIPAMTTARSFREGNEQGGVVYSDPDAVGLEKVWRIGTGVMLLSRKAYMQIPHSAFAMVYKEDEDTYQGEDWTMCEALHKAGIPIYIDHRLSREVGHIGMFNYTHDYVGEIVREPVEDERNSQATDQARIHV